MPYINWGQNISRLQLYCMFKQKVQKYALVAQGIEHWFPVPSGGGSNPSGCVSGTTPEKQTVRNRKWR